MRTWKLVSQQSLVRDVHAGSILVAKTNHFWSRLTSRKHTTGYKYRPLCTYIKKNKNIIRIAFVYVGFYADFNIFFCSYLVDFPGYNSDVLPIEIITRTLKQKYKYKIFLKLTTYLLPTQLNQAIIL